MKPDAAQEGTTAVSSRWMSRLVVAFWVAVAVWVAVWVIAPHCRQKVTLDFAAASRREHIQGQCYAAYFDQRLPKDAYIVEDVRELRCGTTVGGGSYQLDRVANVVYWSSSDGTDPLSNGRHYRLVGVRRWRADKLTLAIVALVPLFLAVVLSVWRRWGRIAEAAGWRRQLVDAIDLHGKSPRWLRWALAVVVLVGFLPVVTSTWNRYAIDTDTWDYCHGTFNRTPLTYFFLKTFDPHCDAVSTQDPRTLLGVFHDTHSEYLVAVRAWKVLWLLAIAALVLVLARFINVWLLAGSICWLTATIPAGSFFDQTFWLDRIISEPLCYCVEILFLAATAQYLCRRRLLWGLVLGGLLAAAVLLRPSNLVFVAVLPVAWLVQRRHDGFCRATLQTSLLVVPLLVGTLVVCQHNRQQYGRFQTYAFKGYYLIAVAMQTATPDDIDSFNDPQMRQFMHMCLTEYKNLRVPEWSVAAADNNTFGIAVPSFNRVYMEPIPKKQQPDLNHYYIQSEETFTAVATTLIRRHPGAYLKLVRANLKVFWKQNPRTHTATLIAFGLAVVMTWRTRRWTWLYLAFFTATPLLATLPCVFTLYPLERYTSQLFFVEIVCLPLVVALAATRGLPARRLVRRETLPLAQIIHRNME